jgi:hypothetical protein
VQYHNSRNFFTAHRMWSNIPTVVFVIGIPIHNEHAPHLWK